MIILFLLMLVMLSGALCIIAMPFVQDRNIFHPKFFIFSGFLILCSIVSYQFTGDKPALQHWLVEGKTHYQLLETFERLGGVNGAIARIQEKLKANPDDAQGWLILGKLYLATNDVTKADAAFAKAKIIENNAH